MVRGLLPARRSPALEAQPSGAPADEAIELVDRVRDVPIEASGRWTVSLRDVSLRPYPFPYRAGFALANEYSYADTGLFEAVHAFLNGRSPTPLGDGLDMEVGDSLAVAEGGVTGPSAGPGDAWDTARLRALVDAGWIDSFYASGPSAAAAVAARLAEWPLESRPGVLLGPATASDRAELAAAGLRFFGDDAWLEVDKFGDHHDHKIAERFQLATDEYDWDRWAGYTTGKDARADARTLVGLMNQTLPPALQADGLGFGFKRYSGPCLPSMPTFSAQVTHDLLDRLTQLAGVVVVQQQLGRWSLVGAAPEAGAARPNLGPVLDRHAVAVWRDIAQRRDAGLLWVATTARLLDYLWRRQALAFAVAKSADRWVITLNELRCPVTGRRAIGPGDLNGLAFTVGEAAPEVVVTVVGWARPLEMRRAADPAHRYRHAVYRPWTALEWIAP
jgi:hypothetical protein